jgi:hypothetical protein
MDEDRVQEHDRGVREVIEVRQPELPGGITFKWHITYVPQDSSEGVALRADQAHAIRELLEWMSGERLRRARQPSDNGSI